MGNDKKKCIYGVYIRRSIVIWTAVSFDTLHELQARAQQYTRTSEKFETE